MTFLAESKVLESADLKDFYGFVNGKLSSRKSIPLLIQNDLRYEDPEEKANLFQEQFISVSTDDDGLLPDFRFKTNAVLDQIDITDARVLNALKRLLNKISCRPDEFPSLLLKQRDRPC